MNLAEKNIGLEATKQAGFDNMFPVWPARSVEQENGSPSCLGGVDFRDFASKQ